MASQYRLSPLTSITKDQDTYTLTFWGAYQEPLVYLLDAHAHPLFTLIESGDPFCTPFAGEFAKDFEELVADQVLVPEDWDRNKAIAGYIAAINNPTHLHLIILPAGTACNCRCVYCGQDHHGQVMTWAHEGQAILRFIEERAPKTLHIEFFGGEPLLAESFILRLCDELNRLGRRTGMEFAGTMTTNGTLLNVDTFKALLSQGVREYQITLDGKEEHHNRQRPLANGANSYQQTLGNLIAIKDVEDEYVVDVRMNFDSLSGQADLISDHLREIKEWIGVDDRFRIRFRPAFDWSGNIETKNLCSKMQAKNSTMEFNAIAQQMGFQMADVGMWAVGGHACYAGRSNSFVIEPGLNVKKCTISESEDNIVGKISRDGKLETNHNMNKWVKNHVSKYDKCNNCAWMPICLNVGCPLIDINGGVNCLHENYSADEVTKLISGCIVA